MANRLAAETSPYLLQHADNPVDWRPWGEEALALARGQDKPILLSIGYSACHWCHVMAHESFEDAAVAEVMNRHFVNIKVDREERPDLDRIYQGAQRMLTGRNGGWPLTMFLAPDGVPFYGGTYFPPTSRFGLPGFAELCGHVARLWQGRRGEIAAQNRELLAVLARESPPSAPDTAPDATPLAAQRALLLAGFDRRHGGFGGAPKFPHPTELAFLLRRAGDAEAREAALLTLARMAAGGIYDQLGGGFCRYSVDERWEIPHFEKMLYDNALLVGLYADAWVIAGELPYLRVVEETVGWLLREMHSPEGAFYASLDADAEGEEGKYYVWDRDEIARLLTPAESALAARCWGLDGPPNFENRHWHLRVAGPPRPEEAALLDAARDKLLAARATRARPGRDDKLLTSWNALMIAGLAHAARVLDRPDWLSAARRSLAFLRERRWRDGRLYATDRLPAYLDDHAYLLAALLELMQAGFHADDLAFARRLADAMLDRFEDAAGGGFYFTAHDHEALIQRQKVVHDEATPAGNGVAALALLRLGHLLGEAGLIDAARRALESCWPLLRQPGGGQAGLLLALEETLTPPHIVILRGPRREVQSWQRRLSRVFLPHAFVIALPNGETIPHPALAKPESALVNAWVCQGVTCHAPTGNFETLRRCLQTG